MLFSNMNLTASKLNKWVCRDGIEKGRGAEERLTPDYLLWLHGSITAAAELERRYLLYA